MKYKLSSFNYFTPCEYRVIYSNGITGKLFSLSRDEHDNIQNLLLDLTNFYKKHTSVFNQFKKWGFIVENSTNEIDIIRFRNKHAVFNDRHYYLVINPTLECNFNCWYCYEEHPKGRMEISTIDRIKKHIEYMVTSKQITGLHLSWFGGEPLLYLKEVIEPISSFAKELMVKNKLTFTHHINTNASLITDESIAIFNNISLKGFQITIDGDEKRHNKIRNANGEPTYSNIIDNIIKLGYNINSAEITLRINYDDKTLDISDIETVLKSIPYDIRKYIRIDYQRVWQTVANLKGGVNERRLFLKQYGDNLGFKIVPNTHMLEFGKKIVCYADKYYHTEINYDGKVYRCTARGYSKKYQYGKLNNKGIIGWNTQKISKHFSKATFENETCLKCSLLPLCLGHCIQKTLELEGQDFYCNVKNDEVSFESFISDSYKNLKQYNEI